MRSNLTLVNTLFAIGCTVAATLTVASADPMHSGPRPVVVELFTSEGCSDCPDADRLLAQLVREQPVQGVRIVGLEEHIDYWNSKHWGDPFSSKLFTDRQYAYSDHFNDNSVYTPEMVVNGDVHFVGSDSDSATEAIARAAMKPAAELEIAQAQSGDSDDITVTVTDAPQSAQPGIDLYIGLTEDGILSHVADGENRGRTLAHGSVVRQLQRIGSVQTGTQTQTFSVALPVPPEWREHPLSIVAFLQSPSSLKIYGSAVQRL